MSNQKRFLLLNSFHWNDFIKKKKIHTLNTLTAWIIPSMMMLNVIFGCPQINNSGGSNIRERSQTIANHKGK